MYGGIYKNQYMVDHFGLFRLSGPCGVSGHFALFWAFRLFGLFGLSGLLVFLGLLPSSRLAEARDIVNSIAELQDLKPESQNAQKRLLRWREGALNKSR